MTTTPETDTPCFTTIFTTGFKGLAGPEILKTARVDALDDAVLVHERTERNRRSEPTLLAATSMATAVPFAGAPAGGRHPDDGELTDSSNSSTNPASWPTRPSVSSKRIHNE